MFGFKTQMNKYTQMKHCSLVQAHAKEAGSDSTYMERQSLRSAAAGKQMHSPKKAWLIICKGDWKARVWA